MRPSPVPNRPSARRPVINADATERQVVVRTAATGLLEIVAVAISPTQSTVQVDGELDLATADLLAAALDDELKNMHRFVRLDLSRLIFIDGAGLEVLVRAHNQFLAARGTIVLTGLSRQVTRLLATTHLDEALFVADGPLPARPTRRPTRHLAVVPASR